MIRALGSAIGRRAQAVSATARGTGPNKGALAVKQRLWGQGVQQVAGVDEAGAESAGPLWRRL